MQRWKLFIMLPSIITVCIFKSTEVFKHHVMSHACPQTNTHLMSFSPALRASSPGTAAGGGEYFIAAECRSCASTCAPGSNTST